MIKTRIDMAVPIELRFWWSVAVAQESSCWPFLRGRDTDGYGRFFDGVEVQPAHRLAWSFSAGAPIPVGLSVLHSCDNPPCCNPAHLRLGTAKDNHADMMRRGRARIAYVNVDVPLHRRPLGDRNGSRKYPERLLRGRAASESRPRKLTEENVLEIRRAYRSGERLTSLAKRFDVGAPQVYRIVHRQRWAWLRDDPALKGCPC